MENEKFKIKDGILTEYTGNDEIIQIPNTVSVIGEGVFLEKVARKIIIPNSVKIIEKNAFRECGISEIIMNDGVVTIGEYAFKHAYCNTITFSKNLKEIQAHAFDFFLFCDLEIHKIELPESIIKIGDSAFSSCEWLVTLPSSVKEIGKGAYSSTEMQEIIIPSKINIIPERAFEECPNLEKVVIENAKMDVVSYYDDYTEGIEDIEKIKTVVSATKIKNMAFANCENLKEVIFPKTLTEIGSNAFSWCISLKKVNIITQEVPLNIETDAFLNSGLEELYICNTSYLNIQYGAFKNLPNLKKIKIIGTEYSNICIDSNAFENCSRLEEINIVTKGRINIKSNAFSNCNELEEINIIAQEINIGDYAFEGCTLLKKLNLQAEVLGISIGKYAFSNCKLLNAVNILPDVITYIYENSFEGCSSLKDINCGKLICLKKDIPLFKCTHEEIMNIIKNSEEIQISLKSREKANYHESLNTYKNDEEEIQKNEKIEEVLEKLDEINKSIKESSKDKGYSDNSLNYNTIEDIVDGIWSIL